VSALEHCSRLPRECGRSRHLDEVPGSHRWRRGLGRERDLFRHAHAERDPAEKAGAGVEMTTAAAVRDESIEPLSVRDELLAVVRVAMAITFMIWLYLANNPFGAGAGDASKRGLLPFQAFARDRA